MKTFIELSRREIADLITAATDRADLLSRLLDDDHSYSTEDIAEEVQRLDDLIEKLHDHIDAINCSDCEENNDD